MKKTLESLRSQFKTEDKSGERVNMPNNYFPFWNMKEGERAVIRFLPDRREDNPFGFLVQKVMHVLEINGEKKSVPCLSMYGEDCPICKVSQEYYKVKNDVEGKKYWKKKQYIAQALVVEDPLPADENKETHEGKLRFIALGYQLYQIIQDAFKSDDTLESVPYNYEDGYDFIIKKSKQGQYASYAVGSKFASRQRALSEDELTVVEEHLTDLSTLLPKHPGREKVQAMLDAALTGGNYQEGGAGGDEETVIVPPKKAAKPVLPVEYHDVPFEVTPKPAPKPAPKVEAEEASSDVDEMLATIKARRQQQRSAA